MALLQRSGAAAVCGQHFLLPGPGTDVGSAVPRQQAYSRVQTTAHREVFTRVTVQHVYIVIDLSNLRGRRWSI